MMQKPVAGDFFGGLTAMLVAVPSAIAYGLIIYSPLGPEWSGFAAFSAIVGTIVIAMAASAFGGSPRLISAPCAPAAAVLSVFVLGLLNEHRVAPAMVPLYLAVVAAATGVLQFAIGKIGGGKIIKYIPYPVVAGYLSGVGVLILVAQLPKLLGTPKNLDFLASLLATGQWKWQSIAVGLLTMAVMVAAPRLAKKVPAAILALAAGMGGYFLLGLADPALLSLEHNKLVVGLIPAADLGYFGRLAGTWALAGGFGWTDLALLATPVLTLTALLSIDTLKTCVVVDVMTQARHDSNRTLVGQGIGNFLAGLCNGVPGAGTMGATMVNLNSGARTPLSGVIAGLLALVVVLFLGPVVAWIPIASLAGILIVLAVRMIDRHAVKLLRHRSTAFDFAVILGVVVAAVASSLIIAAGVGIGLAIALFLREQMRSSVIRRRMSGNQVFSRKTRPLSELRLLEEHGQETMVFQLQGQLFFGTTDKLFTELEPCLKTCRRLILDMQRVQSVDYTAANLLKQIKNILHRNGGVFILVSVPANLPTGANPQAYLRNLGVSDDGESLIFFPDLDSALEWAEDSLIQGKLAASGGDGQPLEPGGIELFAGLSPETLSGIRGCLEERSFRKGECIFRKGDTGRDIHFIRQGNVRIVLPLPDGGQYRLTTFNKGAFFGDMAFLDREARSADAVADDDVMLYVLSRERFDELGASHPLLAAHFFEKLSFVISTRLRQSHVELKALHDG